MNPLLMIAATQGGGAYIPTTPGPDLITNGGFADGTSWTLTQVGTNLPTISGGKLNFVNQDNAGSARATQTLAGGSSPAGSYQYSVATANTRTAGSTVQQLITLFGAGAQNRGSANLGLAAHDGTLTGTIVATGEVTSIRISDEGSDSTADNFTLKLLS